jgi:hypothetical protein
MPNPQTYYKFSFKCTEKLSLFFSYSKSKKAALASWLFWHFQIPLQNWCMWIHQTCKKYFSRGYEEVSLQFIVILNPRTRTSHNFTSEKLIWTSVSGELNSSMKRHQNWCRLATLFFSIWIFCMQHHLVVHHFSTKIKTAHDFKLSSCNRWKRKKIANVRQRQMFRWAFLM